MKTYAIQQKIRKGQLLKVVIAALLLICSFSNQAQNYIDILKVSANTTNANKFNGSQSRTRLNQADADLSVPIRLNGNITLISGVLYEYYEAKLMEDGPIETFGSMTLKMGFNRVFNNRWSGTFVFLPKIASDYGRVHREDFQTGLLGVVKYRKGENLNYKMGLYYNTELFGPFFVPMFGVYYQSPDKKLELNMLLPLQADLNYKLISWLSAGLNFNGQIRSYHLDGSDQKDLYLARSTNEFYGYLKFVLAKNLLLNTKFGYSVARSLRVYDSNDKVQFALPATFVGDHRKQLNTDFADGFIFQLSLVYRIQLVAN